MKRPRSISPGLVVDYGLPAVVTTLQPAKKRRLTVRKLMVLIAVAACAAWIIPPAYLIFDFQTGGSYLNSFTQKYRTIAIDNGLVGRPEKDVEAILGSPTQIRVRDQETGEKTYVYAPVPWFPFGAVEVQCKQGIVISIDPWDD